jgi:hypothetical protein
VIKGCPKCVTESESTDHHLRCGFESIADESGKLKFREMHASGHQGEVVGFDDVLAIMLD